MFRFTPKHLQPRRVVWRALGGVQLSPKELPDRCGWPENLRRFADGRAAPLDAGDDEQIGEEEQGSFLPGAQRRRNGDQVVAVEGAFRRGQVARS